VRVEVDLAGAPESASKARRALSRIADRVPAALLPDVRLLVSELVTNSIRHAGLGPDDTVQLVLLMDDRSLRVEVHDPGGGFRPRKPVPDPTRPSGWGLYLVEELADRWGVDSGHTTRVWFEVDVDRAAAA
jgi:anti-sigma regulatory factor (Ser/Thr protein kinase)